VPLSRGFLGHDTSRATNSRQITSYLQATRRQLLHFLVPARLRTAALHGAARVDFQWDFVWGYVEQLSGWKPDPDTRNKVEFAAAVFAISGIVIGPLGGLYGTLPEVP
jgi:hypothetical protein